MTCEAIEAGLRRSGESLTSLCKTTIRRGALTLLLAAGIIVATGYIGGVLVGDNQPAKASQVVTRTDYWDLWATLDKARAELETAEAAIRNLDAQIVLQTSVSAQQKADIALQQTSAQLRRALVAGENEIEVLTTERAKAEAERDRSRASLHQAELNLSYTNSEIAELDDDVLRNSAPVKERATCFTCGRKRP
jgi:multidrug resistance efflux pump